MYQQSIPGTSGMSWEDNSLHAKNNSNLSSGYSLEIKWLQLKAKTITVT